MIDEEHKEPSVYKLVCVGSEERVVGIHIIGSGSDEVMQGWCRREDGGDQGGSGRYGGYSSNLC